MERLTNIGSNGEIWITDNDETRRFGRKESAYKKLAKYEDLEDKLNGISVKQVVDGFIKTVENQTCEKYERGRILTNEEAVKWNEYKQLEEQGLLLRLPCPIGTTVYNTTWWDDVQEKVKVDGKTFYRTVHKHKVSKSTFSLVDIYNFGKTVFLTKKEAEQKLKEMESD